MSREPIEELVDLVREQNLLMRRQQLRFEKFAEVIAVLMKNKLLEKELGAAMIKALIP